MLQTQLPVPELPAASIRNRLRDANARHRSRVMLAATLAAIVIVGSGSVVAAMLGGVRIWLLGDKASFTMRSFATIANPDPEALRRVMADATFPVVLPVGLPKGTHMERLFYSPVDRPNFIGVFYENAGGGTTQFALFDSSTVRHGEAPALPNGQKLPMGAVAHWTIGNETVIVPLPSQQDTVRAAMSRVSPSESLAQNLPLLYRITILGGDYRIANQADALAPSNGQSVLIDRGHLSEIAGLARERKPLMFSKGTNVVDLPSVNGKPDFAHQKTRRIAERKALSASAVRAAAAVLATNACGSGGRMGSGFTCELLIDQQQGRAYRVWLLPMNGTAPSKYVVDPTTFRVSDAR